MWGSRVVASAAAFALAAALPWGAGAQAVVPSADGSTAGPVIAPVPARPADSLVDAFGVQIHLGYRDTAYADVTRTKQALVGLGVRHVRDNLYSGRPDLYAAMREIAATGIRFNLIMGIPFSWDTPANLVKTLKDNIPTGVVESLEGANEWNLKGRPGWAQELRDHQQALWTAARAEPVTRDLPILAPALGQRTGYAELGDLTGWADLGNAHNYPGGQQPSFLIDQVTAAERTVVPGKPVVFTESGYHNALHTTSGHLPTLESAARDYAPRMLLEHFLRGTQRLYMYELLDQRPDTALSNHEMHFGLVRSDFTRKPSYLALRNLLGLAADPGPAFEAGSLAYAIDGAPADLRQVLLQKRDGTFVLLLWRDVSIYDRIAEQLLPVAPRSVGIRLAETADVTVFQPSQSASPVMEVTGTTGTLSLTGGIVAVEVDPAAPAEEPTAEPTPTPVPEPTAEPTPEPTPEPPVEEPTKAKPSNPRRVTVKVARWSSTVRWVAPADDGGAQITGYTVVEQVSGKRREVGPSVRNVTLRKPLKQRKVRYVVTARNGVGESPRTVSRVVRWR